MNKWDRFSYVADIIHIQYGMYESAGATQVKSLIEVTESLSPS